MTAATTRARVGLACNATTAARCLTSAARARLERVAQLTVTELDLPSAWTEAPPPDPVAEARLVAVMKGLDALILSHGAPRITGAMLDAAPSVRFLGELEGDRFGMRIDVEAATERGVRVVDTTHGSSYPVAEWALGLMLVGLRNAGALFRRLIAGEVLYTSRGQRQGDPGYERGELTGRRVGLIGCGHIGRRLLELLRPFRAEVLVFDPHAPRLLADAYDVVLTSLEHVLRDADVVVCTAPLTAETRGMIGARELDWLPPGTVLVNVSRGAIIDTAALLRRLARGDIIACLDVFDPEPIPVDSPVRRMPNVFITPHIAGVTAACGPRFVDLMTDELERHIAGHETRHDLVPRARLLRASVTSQRTESNE